MKKILIISKNSTLSKIFRKKSNLKNYDVFSHNELNQINFSNYSYLINFSFNPKLAQLKYNKKYDIDNSLSEQAKRNKIFYIFFSTRHVYSNKNILPYKETTHRLYPSNNYGKNKLKIEKYLKKRLKNKLLIVRLSTILYFELISKKKLFMNMVLNNLYKNNQIYFDISNNYYKDFITDNFFVKNLDSMINKKLFGIYNLSSGVPIYPEEIAKNIIMGYGKGKIIFSRKQKPSFNVLLSNKKLVSKTQKVISKSIILNYCKGIGTKLQYA